MTLRIPLACVAVCAIGAAACDALLGMDAPSLARGAGQGPDGSSNEAGDDAGDETSVDAASDAMEFPVRCGGGGFPQSTCAGTTPVCCQGGTASAPTFACVTSEAACAGYAIKCQDENHCPGQQVCCHFMAHQICDDPMRCPGTDLVCDPEASDSCLVGQTCDFPFVGDAGATSPYLGCR